MVVNEERVMTQVDVFALEVLNDERYAMYRAGMTPLLHAMGGRFGFDVKVAEVLKNPSDKAFNRMFSIEFPSRALRDAFFCDPEYLRVRATFFEDAVGARTHLGQLQPGVPLP